MITVTNTNDSGAGSLRAALAAAALGEEITFSVTGTITISSAELAITQDVIITGPGSGSLTIDGDNAFRIFNISSGVNSISGITLINGAGAEGAAIHNESTLTLSDIVIENCTSSDDGGAIWNSSTVSASTLTITSCGAAGGKGGGVYNTGTFTGTALTVTSCTCTNGGGGVFNDGTFTHNGGNISSCTDSVITGGGGIWNEGTYTGIEVGVFSNTSGGNGDGIRNVFGTVTLTRCAVYNNDDINIYNSAGTVNVENSTISGGGTVGSGLYNEGGSVALSHATLTQHLYGFTNDPGSVLTLFDTILAGNTTSDYSGKTADVTSLGHNALGIDDDEPITDATGDIRVLTYADLVVGSMQDNGGPTFTHALLAGSPALNAGDSTGAPATDQRGESRIQGDEIDIGAFEKEPASECLQFTGTLPAWIRVEGNCLIGRSGVFRGRTKAEANARAQAALDAFVAAAQEAGDLVCNETPPVVCSDRESLVVDGVIDDGSPTTTFRGEPGTFYSYTFPVSVVAGQNVTIWAGSPDFDVWLILLNSTQSAELANDDSAGWQRPGDSDNGVITWTPVSTETIYVQVTTWSPQEVGSFRAIVAGGYEYANTPMESPWTAIYVESTNRVFAVGPYERPEGGAFVYVINPSTNAMTAIATYAAPSNARPVLFYNPNDDSVWTMIDDGAVARFVRLDPTTGAVLEVFSAPTGHIFFPAYVPTVNKLFAGKQDNSATNIIKVYNCATRMQEPNLVIGASGQETIGKYIPEIDRVVLQTAGVNGYQLLNPNDKTLAAQITTDIFILYGFYKDGLYYGFEGTSLGRLLIVNLETGAEVFGITDNSNFKWGLFYDVCRDCALVVSNKDGWIYSVTALNLADYSLIDTICIGDIGESNQWPSLVYASAIQRMYFVIGGNSLSSGPPMLGTAFKIP